MKANITYKAMVKTINASYGWNAAIEAANQFFGIETLCGEGYDYQIELNSMLPDAIGRFIEQGATLLDSKDVFFKRRNECCACNHCEPVTKPYYKFVKYNYKDKDGKGHSCKVKMQLGTSFYYTCSDYRPNHDKEFDCIQEKIGIFAFPVERTKDHNTNRALIVSRQVKCTISKAIAIIDILKVLELNYNSEQELLRSAKRHAEKNKLDHWIERYSFLKSELELVASSFNMPEDFEATEISLEGIKEISLDYQEPFKAELESYTETETETDELDEISSDFNSLGEYSYYRFDAIEKIPCAGRYAVATSKKELFSTAKAETKTDHKSFYKRLDELNNNITCPELEKAIAFMKSGKINKAKSLARLKAYTYQGQQAPSWLTPDRLNSLWKAAKA